MRLIDADATVADLEKGMSQSMGSAYEKFAFARAWVMASKTIDAVEVVRCKDCMYCYSDGYCPEFERDIDRDFFCEKGLRRWDDAT